MADGDKKNPMVPAEHGPAVPDARLMPEAVSPLRLAKELRTVSLGNLLDYVDIGEDGVRLRSFSYEKGAALQSFKLDKNGRVSELRLYPKIAALKLVLEAQGLIGRHADAGRPGAGVKFVVNMVDGGRERAVVRGAVVEVDNDAEGGDGG